MALEIVKLQISERKEAEHFGNILFFAIQAAGYTTFWLRAPHEAFWLSIALPMGLQFVETLISHTRLKRGKGVCFQADAEGLSLPTEGALEPVRFSWEDLERVETMKMLTTPMLRLQVRDEKRKWTGLLPLFPKTYHYVPLDRAGMSPEAFLQTLVRFPRTSHLFPETACATPKAA